MAKDINKCSFIGRLGKDTELKYMPNGKAVVNFSIACSDDYKNKQTGEKVEVTNWVNMVAFDRLAEIVGEYCKKGSRIYASGKFVTRKWQDANGNDRYSTEINLVDVQLLDSRADGEAKSHTQPPSPAHTAVPADDDAFSDIIPF